MLEEHRQSLARLVGLAFVLLVSSPAAAFEFLEGRVQVHGFYESQMRVIARDFDNSDDWDLTQWAQILNIEIEADIAPDGWGPFDLLSAFARVEARYDCVWTRGCGMFSSADTYGDRAARLPGRLGDGERAGFRNSATLVDGDYRRFASVPRELLFYDARDRGNSSPKASPFFDIQGLDTLFGVAGMDQIFGTSDDPAPFIFSELDHCRFAFRETRGPENGTGSQVLGPWNPECGTGQISRLGTKPNPMRAGDINPVVLGPGNGGFGELPMRPVPRFNYLDAAPQDQAKGIYLPNQELARKLRSGEFGDTDQNFSQDALAWNHGASQEGERELKELFLDMEFLDSRLWIRAGKQTIVWGKTELFRTTDQFNPQDLALASLPSLEESRVALWAARGVWSFYTVGPLDDVRLELAANFDEFEPNDLGRCGEPYSPLPVCNKTFGLFIHGVTGLGVAGEARPENPWDSFKGWEVGARLEFRWDRFSFALTDFYGYEDLPYQERLFTYSRNVDSTTGRPRHTMATGPCVTGAEASCLQPGQSGAHNALEFHSINQQLFAMICSTSVGLVPNLDPSACGQTVFNSQLKTGTPQVTIAAAVSNLLAGDASGLILAGLLDVPIPGGPCDSGDVASNTLCNPLIQLSNDNNQITNALTFAEAVAAGLTPTPIDGAVLYATGLQGLLSDEQQALLGCGPYYGTFCDGDGVDLMNAELTALAQSWPGIEGAGGLDWNTTDLALIQPATVGFAGGPVCTRVENGQVVILPGCRGAGPDGTPGTPDDDPGYNVPQDGTTTGPGPLVAAYRRFQPFTSSDPTVPEPQSQFFNNELAVLSWNAAMALVALSAPVDQTGDGVPDVTLSSFDTNDPFREEGCSFNRPFLCSNMQSLYRVTGVQRNTLSAAGNERYGRRDFVWQGGTPVVLRYEKRNVLGFSMDWAEDLTKTNWGVEATWIEGLQFTDLDELDRLSEADTYNMTVSIDRPTFINFLNPNRTFFLNMQTFFQYVDGHRKGFASNGPWNTLVTFTIQTGFFRDRLNPNMTFVYDVRSNSGAWLPSIQYRYTENLSVTFGLALFSGRMQSRQMSAAPTALANRAGSRSGSDFVENGLSVVRERDEVFLKLRYTF
jgi:hypothetical protein